jgi:acetate---CoA ligase (ADP-forming)
MPSSPISRESDIVLRDGSTLRLRPARADDAAEIAALFARLHLHAMYRRTFDGARVAEPIADGSRMLLVGESLGHVGAAAAYVREDDVPDRADAVFAIDDALQGRGVGTRMLEALADAARPSGIHTFQASMHTDNESMMRMLRDSGFEIDRRIEGGIYRVVLSIAATPAFEARAAERSQAAATASMRAFFEPASVAVVGASRDRGKIGSEVLHNLLASGYTGRLAVVHPSAAEIDGVTAFPRVTDVTGAVDLAVICVPAPAVAGVIDDCIGKGVKALVIITAGFAETGAEGRAAEAGLLARVRRAGIRLVGPNCMGLINTHRDVRLNATFSPVYPPAGRVAMSTQSGALGLAILDYARKLHIGLSTFVSIGNKADVSSNDLIQYWANDPDTNVILLYVESFGNPRKFSQIARRVARRKPIVAVKSGRSASGARAASSHTGALASSDVIVDALFRQAGVIRTNTLEELFDVASLLANQPVPRGRHVAILTNAGGPGILAADACEAHGLALPALSEASIEALRSFLPATAALGNPIDMIASASAAQYERALEVVLADERVDAVLVIFIPPLVTKEEDVARAVQQVAAAHQNKPVIGIFMSSEGAPPLLAPIPSYIFPEAAATALARAAAYGEWLHAPEGTVPAFDDLDRDGARAIVDAAISGGGGWLTPEDATSLVRSVGIRTAAERTVQTEDAAVEAAEGMGYPVVLKAVGPTLLHKTDVGGVALDLETPDALRRAWRGVEARLGDRMTAGLVQEMVTGGVEMLVGATEDPTFGPVLACAMGGTLAELLADSQFRLHPLTDRDAEGMVSGLRGARLLSGHRGSPPADVPALRDALLRLSALVDLCPEIAEVDVNPLVVLPQGVRALDIRVRVERPRPRPASRRVSY